MRLLAIVFVGSLTSCNFTEEMYLQPDGSGKISIIFDGSEFMSMAGEMEQKDSTKLEARKDTTMYFKDLLRDKKDSIAKLSPDKQARIKRLENFALHMVMDEAKGEFMFDMFTNFKNVNKLNNMMNAFQELSGLDDKRKSPMNMGKKQNTEIVYDFKGSTFSRKAKILDEVLHQQQLDSLKSAEMFLGGSEYTLKYHFPKKVKKVSNENATFGQDGKTLILKVGMLDLVKDPAILDLEVELEK